MMQNQYVGDFGDFVKYGLLRTLIKHETLGVAWYLHPDQGGMDGNKTAYIDQPEIWRRLDCALFDRLNRIVKSGRRSVAAMECSDLLPNALFADKWINANISSIDWRARQKYRTDWFDSVKHELSDCDIIFADPDNGLSLDKNFTGSKANDAKRLPLSEARQLVQVAKGRTAIFYHHNTRRKGGHLKEVQYWMEQLPGCAGAFYCNRDGFRTFFVVTSDIVVKDRLAQFGRRWQGAGKVIWKDKP